MKDLWQRTWQLFRQRPVVLVPTIVASLLALAMERMEKVALRLIVSRFATERSVLGGELPTGDFARLQHRAMIAGVPVGLVCQFLTVCAYVVALVITAHLVRVVKEELRPNLRLLLRLTLTQWRSILLVCVAFMGLVGLCTLMISVLLTSSIASHAKESSFHALLFAGGLIMIACVAWILAPWAIRLLRHPAPVPSAGTRMLARTFAITAFAAQPVLGEILRRAERNMILDRVWEFTGLAVVNTVVTYVPIAFLFVSLALLAMEPGVREEGEPEPQFDPQRVADDGSTGG